MASTHGKCQSEADANKPCSPGLSPTSFPGLYLPSRSFPWRLRVLLLCPATSPNVCCSFVKSSKRPSESPGTDAPCLRDAWARNFCLSFINLWPMKFAQPQPMKWRWVEEYSPPPTLWKVVSSESITWNLSETFRSFWTSESDFACCLKSPGDPSASSGTSTRPSIKEEDRQRSGEERTASRYTH